MCIVRMHCEDCDETWEIWGKKIIDIGHNAVCPQCKATLPENLIKWIQNLYDDYDEMISALELYSDNKGKELFSVDLLTDWDDWAYFEGKKG